MLKFSSEHEERRMSVAGLGRLMDLLARDRQLTHSERAVALPHVLRRLQADGTAFHLSWAPGGGYVLSIGPTLEEGLSTLREIYGEERGPYTHIEFWRDRHNGEFVVAGSNWGGAISGRGRNLSLALQQCLDSNRHVYKERTD